MEKGLIHLYFGDGKGKTTAATGIALRYAAFCNNIIFCRFMKTSESGELKILEKLGIKILHPNIPSGFSWTLSDSELEETRRGCSEVLRKAAALCKETEQGLLVLDEIAGAFNKHLIDRELVIDFLDHRPPYWEIVMTGRTDDKELLVRADYLTEMRKIRHPFDKGVKARTGVEK